MSTVVILPGLDGTSTMLDGFCASLTARGIDAHAIEYPRDKPLDYDELLLLARARLPSEIPFVLLGESFSGPIAIRIAADPPVNLKALVLSTTFARKPVLSLAPLASLLRFAPALPPTAVLSWSLLGPWSSPLLCAQLISTLRTVSPDVLRARAALALRVDVSDYLERIRVPVLQLIATRDRLLSRSASTHLARGLPAADSISINGPHLLLQTATKQTADLVAKFVRAQDVT